MYLGKLLHKWLLSTITTLYLMILMISELTWPSRPAFIDGVPQKRHDVRTEGNFSCWRQASPTSKSDWSLVVGSRHWLFNGGRGGEWLCNGSRVIFKVTVLSCWHVKSEDDSSFKNVAWYWLLRIARDAAGRTRPTRICNHRFPNISDVYCGVCEDGDLQGAGYMPTRKSFAEGVTPTGKALLDDYKCIVVIMN